MARYLRGCVMPALARWPRPGGGGLDFPNRYATLRPGSTEAPSKGPEREGNPAGLFTFLHRAPRQSFTRHAPDACLRTSCPACSEPCAYPGAHVPHAAGARPPADRRWAIPGIELPRPLVLPRKEIRSIYVIASALHIRHCERSDAICGGPARRPARASVGMAAGGAGRSGVMIGEGARLLRGVRCRLRGDGPGAARPLGQIATALRAQRSNLSTLPSRCERQGWARDRVPEAEWHTRGQVAGAWWLYLRTGLGNPLGRELFPVECTVRRPLATVGQFGTAAGRFPHRLWYFGARDREVPYQAARAGTPGRLFLCSDREAARAVPRPLQVCGGGGDSRTPRTPGRAGAPHPETPSGRGWDPAARFAQAAQPWNRLLAVPMPFR